MTASAPPGRERQWLVLLAAVQFTHLVDFMLVMPLGPELMHGLGLTAARFGALVSAYTLASAAMGLLGVFWLDRFERKRTLLVLYAGFVLATVGCGVAPTAVWLWGARTLAGSCAGLMGAVVMALLGELIPAERRGRAIGTVMSSLGLSAVVGVPTGLLLASQGGWRTPFWGLAVLGLGVWLCLWRLLPEVPPGGAPEAGRAAPRETSWPLGLVWGWALTFCVVFASFLLIPYLGTFMVGNLGLGLSDLSGVYLCGGVATLLSARWMGRLADRHGPARVLTWLLLGTMGPHLLFTHLSVAPPFGIHGLFALFMALTSCRSIPTLALLSARVPPALRGRYLAVNMAASDGASGLAAWVSGLWLTEDSRGALHGFDHLGWSAVAVSALALGVLWFFERGAPARSVLSSS